MTQYRFERRSAKKAAPAPFTCSALHFFCENTCDRLTFTAQFRVGQCGNAVGVRWTILFHACALIISDCGGERLLKSTNRNQGYRQKSGTVFFLGLDGIGTTGKVVRRSVSPHRLKPYITATSCQRRLMPVTVVDYSKHTHTRSGIRLRRRCYTGFGLPNQASQCCQSVATRQRPAPLLNRRFLGFASRHPARPAPSLVNRPSSLTLRFCDFMRSSTDDRR